jgi:4a-hydroxytetrahydrobiopterin dehydratase
MPHNRNDRALSRAEIEYELARLPGWAFDRDRRALYRRMELSDFAETFALMMRIAIVAEKADHHPEWSNVYNRLDIWLKTHDVDGVSGRDVALAATIDHFTAAARD